MNLNERVEAFNNVFKDFYITDKQALFSFLKQQFDGVVKEEVNELEKAINEQDIVEVLDAYVDCAVVLSGIRHILKEAGYDMDKAEQLVLDNNDSKFIAEESPFVREMEDTAAMYKTKGVDGRFDYGHLNFKRVYYFIDDKGKLRKPYNFIPVNLDECVPNWLKQ